MYFSQEYIYTYIFIVGFIVNKNIAGNDTSFKSVSDRLAQLTIRINGKYHLNIIQAYLPTSSHGDQEVENVYEDIDNLITNSKAHYNVIMGDSNAKVGLGDPVKSCIGPYGLGARNTRGDSLIKFAESHQLKIMNTFFKKRLHRRWTWISPNGVTRNEINYILTDKPQTFMDVSVINSFNTGSDHRMIRGSMTINTRQERARLIKRPSKANAVALSAKVAEFQMLLTNKFEALNSAPSDNIDTYCDSITSSITEAALKTAGKDKAQRHDKLSLVTKQLREKRWQMKRNGSDVQHIEYTEICKAMIRSRMSDDINNYNEQQLTKSLEYNKGIKTIKSKQCLGRSNIISLKEENGTHIHDRDRMIKRCEEFYTNLYSTKLPQGQPSVQIHNTRSTPPPPILPTEVSAAIKRLKQNKTPGNDITADNYRPISLLPITYKVFSQVILRRMLRTLDQHQPREQAGFRSGFSTIDHIQLISQLQEKADGYKIPLCFAFVDYEKAFDSIEFNPLFESLENQGVEAAYITLLQDLYNGDL